MVKPSRRGRLIVVIRRHRCRRSAVVPAKVTTFGFNEDPSIRNFRLQKGLGLTTRRLFVRWNSVQLARGWWDWRIPDSLYASAVEEGIRPLWVLTGAPCWANPSSRCLTETFPDASHDRDWAEFVRRFIARYPVAVAIEIWNEPNLTITFQPRLDARRFTAMLKHAYSAVKSVAPGTPVISGGLLTASASSQDLVSDSEYLASMYAAGAAGSMDAIGYHAYPATDGRDGTPWRWDAGAMGSVIDRVRNVRNAAGDASTPIWVTEMGISTRWGPGFPAAISEAQQAEGLIAMASFAEADPDITVAIFHRLIDAPSIFLPDTGFGVFRIDETPKPAACELSKKLQGQLRC